MTSVLFGVINGPCFMRQVSDGAEVIKISKRFFLQHAQNNTMLRVETMVCYSHTHSSSSLTTLAHPQLIFS